MPQRDYYIDRLRAVMTALVILHHTAETYGAPGGWQWGELKPSQTPTSILFSLFAATDVAFLMGFFFLLAGYFTPASLEKKGYARFLVDRFVRLGIPLLAFGLVLAPLTFGIYGHGLGDGFWPPIQKIWQHREFISGPLWFAQALIVFSLAYCVWRAVFGAALATAQRTIKPIPSSLWWLLSALSVAAAALALVKLSRSGVESVAMQFAYRPIYVFMFALGIAAWRYDWLRQLSWAHARPWVWGLAITWPALPLATFMMRAWGRSLHPAAHTSTILLAILQALWVPFISWGIISALLLVFRAKMNQPSAFWNWLNRRAYAVYIIHPPVLVSIAMLLHGWMVPALVKFAVVGPVACAATWLLSDPLVRLPGLRRVV